MDQLRNDFGDFSLEGTPSGYSGALYLPVEHGGLDEAAPDNLYFQPYYDSAESPVSDESGYYGDDNGIGTYFSPEQYSYEFPSGSDTSDLEFDSAYNNGQQYQALYYDPSTTETSSTSVSPSPSQIEFQIPQICIPITIQNSTEYASAILPTIKVPVCMAYFANPDSPTGYRTEFVNDYPNALLEIRITDNGTFEVMPLDIPTNISFTVEIPAEDEVAPEQRPIDVIAEQPQIDVIPEQRPNDGIPEQPPHDVIPEQPPHDVIPEQPPHDVIPEQRPIDVIPEQRPINVISEQPPNDVIPEQRPIDVIPEQRPINVIPEQRPEEAITDFSPPVEITHDALVWIIPDSPIHEPFIEQAVAKIKSDPSDRRQRRQVRKLAPDYALNWCPFCRSKKKSVTFYNSHGLRDWAGILTCPVLRGVTCKLCGATGDDAHTIKHCPLHKKDHAIGTTV